MSLYVEFGEPVFLRGNESMFIYNNNGWDSLTRSLMYELMPQIYNDTLRCFEASTVDFDYLIRRANEMNLTIEVNCPQKSNSDCDDADSNSNLNDETNSFNYKTKPYKHQIEGVQFGLEHDRFILGDDMGLGKTKQIIDLSVIKKHKYNYKHCLIICGVNGLKWNWESEIKIHSDEKSQILGCRKNNKGKYVVKGESCKLQDLEDINTGKLDDTYFIITNVETLRNKAISDKLKFLCDTNKINMIAVDEMHKCATNNSQQSKGLLKLRSESMIAMSGSLIMNNPLDLYMPLHWLGYDRHEFRDFENHFCRFGAYKNITGFKNMEQIQEILKVIMLRRLKSDVLDLPEKIYSVEYVEMSAKQQKIYDEVLNGLREQVDLIACSKNPLANLIRLRQATGHTSTISSSISESAKMDRLRELVKEYVNAGHKCIIFSNWTSMTDILKIELMEYNPAIVTGATKDKISEKDRFMNGPECKIIIGTIGALGTGFTLTAADTVFFLDEPFTSANKIQAEDRAHRIGAKRPINIITLITKNSIDERIHELVERKKLISDNIIDNLDCVQITQLLNFLLF